MSKFKITWPVYLLLWVASGALAQDWVAALPGAGSESRTVALVSDVSSHDISVAPGVFKAVASPSGRRIFYLSNAGGVSYLSVTDAAGVVVAGLERVPVGSEATTMAIAPSGNRLVVLAGSVYVFDISGDNLKLIGAVQSGEHSVSSPIDVAFSHDGRRAFVASGNMMLHAIDLTINAVVNSLELSSYANGIGVAPNGLLYVAGYNSLVEINGHSEGGAMEVRSVIPLPHDTVASKPVFSPGGRYILLRNLAPSGPAVSVYDVREKTIGTISLLSGNLLSSIAAVSDEVFYGIASGTLLRGDIGLAYMAPATFARQNPPAGGVNSIVMSREVPQAARMYLSTTSGEVWQIDVASGVVQRKLAAPIELNYISSAATGVSTAVAAFNAAQTVGTTARTVPLVVRAIGSAGRPLSGVHVSWSAGDVASIVAMEETNTDGYAQAVVRAPAAEGTYSVTATLGEVVRAFQIVVSGTGAGGGNIGPPEGVHIIRGNGEIVTTGRSAPPELEVEVRDEDGKPVSDATVVWKVRAADGVTVGGGWIQPPLGAKGCTISGGQTWSQEITCLTDTNGRTVVDFGGLNNTSNSLAYIVSATSGGHSAEFFETVLPSTIMLPQSTLKRPEIGTIVTAPIGVPLAEAIKISVLESPLSGHPLPNVAIDVSTMYEPVYGPTAACEGGPVLTDNEGIAVCNLIGGGKVGQTALRISVGGIPTFEVQLRINVVPGPAKTIIIRNGDSQSGVPGQTLGVPLLAELQDASGNPIAYADTTFQVVKGSGVLTPASTVSDAYGRVSTKLTLGNVSGEVQVLVKAGLGQATFKATVQGLVSNNFLNGASFAPGVTAGSIVAVAGEDVLGSTAGMAIGSCITKTSPTGELPTQLGNVEFWFGTVPAPIFAVCRTGETTAQVNIQVPWELTPGPLDVTIKSGVGTTAPKENVVPAVNVAAAAPGAFLWATEGKTLAVATREDGSLVTPSKPAKAGDKLRVFATGLGPVAPEAKTNVPGVAGQAVVFTPVVQVAGVGASGVRAAYAENSLGVYWVEFVVPATTTKGEVPLKVAVTTDKGVLIEAPAASLFVE